ncbi:Alpha-L-fucosidase [Planctomycetes bacterium CA13]|uniref:alpha-L-fucosidase n=1 Tax=Novipirellula herctigrandis TaxID=2527986 RepID=A0A5C5Z8C9_9BACT|nr:Alpha-L-fucosidase [Planctomycetes bacterium CA13]
MLSSRLLLILVLLGCNLCSSSMVIADERDWSEYPMQEGTFDRSWDSLGTYQVPSWFKDAKLGIWAIIGPQCVPMQGDWYARHMYVEGHRQYEHHVKTYGHPSKFGYKDLIEQFDPEKLDFDKLVGLYKQAGAKYAVILAVHHDNFDLWDSKYHAWNSVNMGPKRDLVGEFRDAAKKHGVRFGVTTHLARSFSWLQTSHGADTKGPFAGISYDGANPKYQSLYHSPSTDSPRYPSNPPEQWQHQWYSRVKDLIDQYRPDLMYFDGGYPFDDGSVGRQLVAHYYNINTAWHDGQNDAAMCIKNNPPEHGAFRDGTCVRDIERGKTAEIADQTWQTDTCIGGWYYRVGTRYKTVPDIVRMLIDIVSKNGNLLLNIPLHPDGTIDEQEEAILVGLGKWMAVNGAGLYETRPWLVYGEGPSLEKKGEAGRHGGVKDIESFVPGDLRFVTKGDDELFAFLMAWPPQGQLTIRSLVPSQEGDAKIESVEMLGVEAALTFQQTPDGLVIELPEYKPCEHAWTLRINGRSLRKFTPR